MHDDDRGSFRVGVGEVVEALPDRDAFWRRHGGGACHGGHDCAAASNVTKVSPYDLAHGVRRQLRHRGPHLGHLVARELAGADVTQPVEIDLPADGFDQGGHPLAEALVRHPEDCRRRDLRTCREDALDLSRIDIGAAANDDDLLAADDREPAVRHRPMPMSPVRSAVAEGRTPPSSQ